MEFVLVLGLKKQTKNKINGTSNPHRTNNSTDVCMCKHMKIKANSYKTIIQKVRTTYMWTDTFVITKIPVHHECVIALFGSLYFYSCAILLDIKRNLHVQFISIAFTFHSLRYWRLFYCFNVLIIISPLMSLCWLACTIMQIPLKWDKKKRSCLILCVCKIRTGVDSEQRISQIPWADTDNRQSYFWQTLTILLLCRVLFMMSS